MDKPTQEQIREFWEWCGWKIVKDIGLWRSIRPDGSSYMSTIDKDCICLLFEPLDLNNLFKYAVPKLQDKGNNVELYAYEHKGYRATVYKDCFTQRGSDGYDPFLEPISQVKDDNPALALFWALWQVKDIK